MTSPTPDIAELRRLAEAARDLPSGSDWLHGEVGDGTETVAEWMDKCSADPDALAAGRLHLVWSEGSGETKVIVQAIVGDTETAPIRAAFMANANPAVVLALLDAAVLLADVREQVARGALCPMCSTGMTRRTVGMVCQLCGTDYARPEYASLRRDSEQTTKAALAEALTVRAERDALAAKVERVRRECLIGKGYAGWAAMSRAVLAILDEEPQP